MKRMALVLAMLLVLPVAAQVDDYRDIKYPKLPKQTIPSPEVHTLSNGLQLFLIEDHELPLINVSGRIRTGNNYEPADKAGLADFVGQAMREGGTATMDGDAMDDFLESRAASVETGMGGDFGSASMSCLADQFDEVLPVFLDVLRNPSFAEDKIDLARQQARTGIARRNDDISGIAGREFSRLIHGADSPLSQMLEYATVESITRDDLVAWHQRYYHPNNMMLGIVGDFDSAEMKAKIEAAFAGWPKGPDAALPKIPAGDPKPGVYFVEKSDVTQSYVQLGHVGIRTDNPDYHAVEVMNEILGGGMTSRLFRTVRSKKSLAYSVGGGIGAGFLRKGTFSVGLSTKSESTAAAIDALLEEINGMLTDPPTDAELSRARETMLSSYVFNYTSTRQILGQQLSYAYYGLPTDFLDRYRSGIEQVTRDDVARVAKKYIHPDKLVTLVVGKSEDFDRPLSEFGEVKPIDITIPAPPASGPKIVRNAETLAAGKAMLEMSAARIRGDQAAVTSIQGDYTIALSMSGQTMSLGQKVAIRLPDKVSQTVSTPMGNQAVVINGTRGMMSAGGQSQAVPASDIAEELEDLKRELIFIVSQIDAVEAVAGETSDVDGNACTLVAATLEGIESVLCIAEDGSVLSQSYQGTHPFQGTPGQVTVVFSDYRDAGGYSIPHKRVMLFEGEAVVTLTTNSVALNPQIEDSVFEIPE